LRDKDLLNINSLILGINYITLNSFAEYTVYITNAQSSFVEYDNTLLFYCFLIQH